MSGSGPAVTLSRGTPVHYLPVIRAFGRVLTVLRFKVNEQERRPEHLLSQICGPASRDWAKDFLPRRYGR